MMRLDEDVQKKSTVHGANIYKKIMWEEQLVDPPIHYITSVITPLSRVLNKPVNPEPCY